MMLTSIPASLITSANTQPFQASSPPAWNANMPASPNNISSLSQAADAQMISLPSLNQRLPVSIPSTLNPASSSNDAYVSKIGILASSIPYYHNQYMEHKKKLEREWHARLATSHGEDMTTDEAAYFSKLTVDPNKSREQSSEEQAATANRLKPHSRSTLQLQYITSQAREKPEELTRVPSKKNKTRWQFGIRSRNLPHEAMHCVYKALTAQKANWEVPRPSSETPGSAPSTYPVHVAGATHLNRTLSRGDSQETEQQENDDDHYNFDGPDDEKATVISSSTNTTVGGNDDEVDPAVIPEGYIPKDPWCIKVRWRKDGMYPPGNIHPGSANSSRLDLSVEDARRRSSIIGSLSSAAASTTSVGTGHLLGVDGPEGACYVYMDVQLYTLEAGSDKQNGTFLVDFKCAGYESIVETAVSETDKILVGSGYRVASKDVTSPQPFLDLTNKLVVHLAGGGG